MLQQGGLNTMEALVVSMALVIFTFLCFKIDSLSALYWSVFGTPLEVNDEHLIESNKEPSLRECLQEAYDRTSGVDSVTHGQQTLQEQREALKIEIEEALKNVANPRRISDVFALSKSLLLEFKEEFIAPTLSERKMVGELYEIIQKRSEYLRDKGYINESSLCEILRLWGEFQAICSLCAVDHQLYKDLFSNTIPRIVDELASRTAKDIHLQLEAFVLM
jgi:hypothetical protein